jgi:hypothetical protein
MNYLQIAQALDFYKPDKLTKRELKVEVLKSISYYPDYVKELAKNNGAIWPPTVRKSIYKIANALLSSAKFRYMVEILQTN